jgi:hypothetical protein
MEKNKEKHMLAPIPMHQQPALNKELSGFFGKFGRGSNVEVRYLQSVITHEFLSNIKLIEEIDGSDKWNVKDLFQRNVDHDRVENELVPYFKDKSKVKFFPPLTLVLLPMNSNNVVSELKKAKADSEKEQGVEYKTYGDEEYFKFYDCTAGHQYSYVKWNDEKVKVVAVDGQHRLTAFKSWANDPEGLGDLESMSIPVVILGFSKFEEGPETPELLDVVRSTFVYINSKAQKINESRRILLDDESVNCVCTQEVVQYAHSNDQKDFEELEKDKMPLMMVDWRGEEKEGKPQPIPSSIFSVRDIKDWLHEYILGDPETEREVSRYIIPRLFLDDEVPSFNVSNFPLSHIDSKTVRENFKEYLLPSVMYVLQNIAPFKKYISELRGLQGKSIEDAGSAARHAFKWVCFGKSSFDTLNRDAVEVEYSHLCSKFSDIKEDNIPRLLSRDIGIRAIWSSFSILKEEVDDFSNTTKNWKEFSKWYVELVNQVIEDDWFESFEDNPKANIKFLTHIAFSPSGQIINYKPSAVDKGLGALISMLILKKYGDIGLTMVVWDNLKDSLSPTIRRGFRSKNMADLNTDFTGSMAEFRTELNKRIQKDIDAWISDFEQFLDI